MPAKNPRLSIVITPSMAATLAALSEVTGESASGLVRTILGQTEPALQRMLQLLTAAKAAKGQIGQGMRETMRRVVDDLEHAIAVAHARQDGLARDLVEAAEEVKGRKRAGGAGGAAARAARPGAGTSDPRPVTRGSGALKPPSTGPATRGKRGAL